MKGCFISPQDDLVSLTVFSKRLGQRLFGKTVQQYQSHTWGILQRNAIQFSFIKVQLGSSSVYNFYVSLVIRVVRVIPQAICKWRSDLVLCNLSSLP